jgi:hypothetical protein
VNWAVVVGVVVVFGAVASFAWASGTARPPGIHNGVITVCIEKLQIKNVKTSGDLNVLHCRSGERRLSWSIRGPEGPPGPAGPAGPAGPSGQATPTLTTDTLTYAPGATVTYAGVNWTNCTNVKLDTFGQGGFTVASGITPAAAGTFTGTFAGPSATGEYLLVAQGVGTNCHALTIFTVAS